MLLLLLLHMWPHSKGMGPPGLAHVLPTCRTYTSMQLLLLMCNVLLLDTHAGPSRCTSRRHEVWHAMMHLRPRRGVVRHAWLQVHCMLLLLLLNLLQVWAWRRHGPKRSWHGWPPGPTLPCLQASGTPSTAIAVCTANTAMCTAWGRWWRLCYAMLCC